VTRLDTIYVVLATTMQTVEWEVALPLDVPVKVIIAKLVQSPDLPFHSQDDLGQRISYRLLWQAANRYLSEAETLRGAGVEAASVLIMTVGDVHDSRVSGVRVAFTIMPFGSAGLQNVYRDVVRPTLNECGFQCIRGDDILGSEVIRVFDLERATPAHG
jgi:hypothetical protein